LASVMVEVALRAVMVLGCVLSRAAGLPAGCAGSVQAVPCRQAGLPACRLALALRGSLGQALAPRGAVRALRGGARVADDGVGDDSGVEPSESQASGNSPGDGDGCAPPPAPIAVARGIKHTSAVTEEGVLYTWGQPPAAPEPADSRSRGDERRASSLRSDERRSASPQTAGGAASADVGLGKRGFRSPTPSAVGARSPGRAAFPSGGSMRSNSTGRAGASAAACGGAETPEYGLRECLPYRPALRREPARISNLLEQASLSDTLTHSLTHSLSLFTSGSCDLLSLPLALLSRSLAHSLALCPSLALSLALALSRSLTHSCAHSL
jgi:hypothetical protein